MNIPIETIPANQPLSPAQVLRFYGVREWHSVYQSLAAPCSYRRRVVDIALDDNHPQYRIERAD